jgi:uncharacterized membrane protein
MKKKEMKERIQKNKTKWLTMGIGLTLLALGVVLTLVTRAGALAEDAANGAKIPFALGLIMVLVGIVVPMIGALPERKPTDVRTLSMAALFAALCYIGFSYCKIDIPVGMEKTAFHLGNVFCVLAALFIGGFWGGMSGAIGMTIADLTTAYVTSAPKTFLLKLCIGLITGFVAHKVFHLSRDDKERKVPLTVATALSCVAGMAFNIVADPVVGYFYKLYLFGIPQDASKALAKIATLTTAVNAALSLLCAVLLYLALRPVLIKAGLFTQLEK